MGAEGENRFCDQELTNATCRQGASIAQRNSRDGVGREAFMTCNNPQPGPWPNMYRAAPGMFGPRVTMSCDQSPFSIAVRSTLSYCETSWAS